MVERAVKRWEWIVTVLGDVAALIAVGWGYMSGDSFLFAAGICVAAFTFGFGHAVNRDRKS